MELPLPSYLSFSDYLRKSYMSQFVVESRLEGTCGVSIIKTMQGSGAYPDPPLPTLSLQYARRLKSVTPDKVKGRSNLGEGYFDVRVGTGTFCVVPPGTPTDFEFEGILEGWLVGIPQQWAETLVESVTTQPSCEFGRLQSGEQTDKVTANLIELLHHPDTLEADNALLIDGLVMTLVGRLITLSQTKVKRREIPALEKTVLTKVQGYLEESLAENHTLEHLAALTGMDLYEFAKRFKTATGFSPYQYVLEQRVERVKDLLRHSTLSLMDVAQSVGFSSQAHMTKVFKKRTGVSPHAYRRAVGTCSTSQEHGSRT
jgi:AraC family transcriptional regulator